MKEAIVSTPVTTVNNTFSKKEVASIKRQKDNQQWQTFINAYSKKIKEIESKT